MTRATSLLFGSLFAALTSSASQPAQAAPSAWEQLQGMAIPCSQASTCAQLSRAELERLSCTQTVDSTVSPDWQGACLATEALLKYSLSDRQGYFDSLRMARAACTGDCPTRDRLLAQVEQRIKHTDTLQRLIGIHWLDLNAVRHEEGRRRLERYKARGPNLLPLPPPPPLPPPIPPPEFPLLDDAPLPLAHPDPLYAASPGSRRAVSPLPPRALRRHMAIVDDYFAIASAQRDGQPVPRAEAARLARLESESTVDELYYACTEMLPVEACRIHVEWVEYQKASPYVVEALPPRG